MQVMGIVTVGNACVTVAGLVNTVTAPQVQTPVFQMMEYSVMEGESVFVVNVFARTPEPRAVIVRDAPPVEMPAVPKEAVLSATYMQKNSHQKNAMRNVKPSIPQSLIQKILKTTDQFCAPYKVIMNALFHSTCQLMSTG